MNSPFAWPGGKRSLKKLLLTLIPRHRCYVEVFSGSAKLLFAKEPSEWEVINDINEDLINFFRVAKHRPAELAEMFEQECIHSRRFAELRALPAKMPLEIEGALRFLYLNWWSFGGKGEHFANHKICQLDHSLPVKRPLSAVRDVLLATSKRLDAVLIECRDFEECVRRYDSRHTFFYCDPPYTNFQPNGRYDPLGAERDAQLAELLLSIKGKFLLSYDDAPAVRKLYRRRGIEMKRVNVRYTLGSNNRSNRRDELIIANYQL